MMSDDELLEAYLDADLGDEEVAVFEERLVREPTLAARLDRLADLRVQLEGLDEALLPTGLEERLAARLAAERADNVVAFRPRRRIDWSAVGLAAAGLVAVTIFAGGLLRGVGGGGAATDSGGAESVTLAEEDAEGGATTEAAAAAPEPEQLAPGGYGTEPASQEARATPVVLADEDDVRRRYATESAAGEFHAGDNAMTNQRPDLARRCANRLAEDAEVTQTEVVVYAGEKAVVFVTADPPTAVVLATDGCETLAVVALG